MLELKNIFKTYEIGKKGDKNYQTVEALKGIDISFRKTEFVSILGPSGCGKTTLLNIIGGLDQYSDGDLIINGVSTKKYKDKDWDNYRNHKIGFVFQSYNLIPHQTVLENVELALTLSGVNKQVRKQKATIALQKVGLQDKLNAKPSQLSGGQMQRVAIARAIVNDPDIILADEPTGALDTKTSVQIMELLKEISKEKLIIMVTHNPELAEKYSTRIVKLLDGKVLDDSLPFTDEENFEKDEIKGKTNMSYLTALSLSGKNLLTKKGRTALVSFAGSIGIIGISLILSLSSGFQNYINTVQEDTLSTYPMTIEKDQVDYSAVLELMMNNNSFEPVEDNGMVSSNSQMVEMFNKLFKESSTNNLKHFKEYIDNDEFFKDYTISYTYNTNLNVYDSNDNLLNPSTTFTDLLKEIVKASGSTSDMTMIMQQASMMNTDVFSEMLDNPTLLESQYNLVGNSRWPSNYDECVLVINENNTLTDYALYALGLSTSPTLKEIAEGIVNNENYEIKIDPISYETLLNTKFNILLDTDYYQKQEDGTYLNKKEDSNYVKSMLDNTNLSLKIVGIVKPNSDAVAHSIKTPIGYCSSLTREIINRINDSEIVKKQKDNPNIDVLTGKKFPSSVTQEEKVTYIKNYINNMSKEELILMLQQNEMLWNNLKQYQDDEVLLKEKVNEMIDTMKEQMPSFIDKMYSSLNEDDNSYTQNMINFGVNDLSDPSSISFYCTDFESKDRLKDKITEYNNMVKNDPSLGENYEIVYSDYVALMMSSISTIINIISYVLIAFVSVSLVVSSIMIGIITYISVLERTKEIGVLRSIGASKKDIKNVFTAESLIIGLISGLLGIGVTCLLNVPINLIINAISNMNLNVAKLPILGGVLLVILSCLLTFIAGLVPSRIASKKDPVIALRSE